MRRGGRIGCFFQAEALIDLRELALGEAGGRKGVELVIGGEVGADPLSPRPRRAAPRSTASRAVSPAFALARQRAKVRGDISLIWRRTHSGASIAPTL